MPPYLNRALVTNDAVQKSSHQHAGNFKMKISHMGCIYTAM